MIEKEIERYFNERLVNYKKAVYKELVNMFGSECELFIREALEVPVAYQVDKYSIDFYDDITDQLNAEEQSVVDYFKERLGENEAYVIGSSIGNITNLMKENTLSRYRKEGREEFIGCYCINNPYLCYLRDESYIQVLIYKIGLSLKIRDMGFEINENIRWALSIEIVNRLHSKGFYLFDSKSLMEEYESVRKEFFDSASENKDYDRDRYLLSPILDVLPLYFTNRDEFYRIVDERNYSLLMDGIARKDRECIYYSINKMKECIEKNRSSEIVMVDVNTITRALKSMREKQQTQSLETEKLEEKVSTLSPQRVIIPRGRNIRLIEGLDIQSIINKTDHLQFKINNIENIQPIINNYGEKILYIDEDGKDTLNPPSARTR